MLIDSILVILGTHDSCPSEVQEGLATLYLLNHQPGKAIKQLLDFSTSLSKQELEIRTPVLVRKLYDWMEQHPDLEDVVLDKVAALMSLDPKKGAQLLIRHAWKDISAIVIQLKAIDDLLLLDFIQQLFRVYPNEFNLPQFAVYHDMQVGLLAKHAPSSLLPFLQHSHCFSLPDAYKVAQTHLPPLYNEMVYLLGKMGGEANAKEALELVVKHLRSIPQAIDFISRQNSCDSLVLNAYLLELCVVSPKMLTELISYSAHIGSLNPAVIVKAIPPKIHLDHPSMLMQKLFADSRNQVSLYHKAMAVQRRDLDAMMTVLHAGYKKGVFVDQGECRVCGCGLSKADDFVVFYVSGEVMHQRCKSKEYE